VVDNNRIDEFTPWGQFVKAWGGGVVSGGASGTGILASGSTTVNTVTTTSKEFVSGMAIEGIGIAPGTTVSSYGEGTLTISKPATGAATGAPTTLTSPEGLGNVPTNELQRITVTATGGSFGLKFQTNYPDFTTQTTANLPYNASAAQVQSALEALPNIGAGNVAVTSSNPGGAPGVPGGPYQVEFKGTRFADTSVIGLVPTAGTPPLSGGTASVAPVRQGASAPEVCSEECRGGVDGNKAGQFSDPTGITVDSNGDLYALETLSCIGGSNCVEELHNNRVQKFDSDGNFLLMFGGGVDEGGGNPSNPGNLCTAEYLANGDACGGGQQGSGDGEFGSGQAFGIYPKGSYIAAGPGNTIYVGGGEGRIQQFDSQGNYLKSLPVPGETVSTLAVDNSPTSPSYGDLYVAYYKSEGYKENVRKLDPNSGAVLGTLEASRPTAISTDAMGRVYVYNSGNGSKVSEVIDFDPSGKRVLSFGKGELDSSVGIATSSACGIEGTDIFVANLGGYAGTSFIALYGSNPDPSICPPPSIPPSINAQFATAADSGGATLKAKINPHFWPDTRYYVQYGTGKCSEGGCDQEQPASPGSLLTKEVFDGEVTTASVFIEGLASNTTYHYRFVATSGGGGPVLGVGGTEAQEGAEGSFHTLPNSAESNTGCANQSFRIGASAKLPDCRAYELVSPLDKNNGDIEASKSAVSQAAADGQRMTFFSNSIFANPEAGPLASQYLAERQAGEGWSTRSISPPRNSLSLYPTIGNSTFQYKAFSESLCGGWVVQGNDIALAPGAPAGVPNLYRRDLCGASGYELLTSTPAPGFGDEVESIFYPQIQGFSADETHSVFRLDAALRVSDGSPQPPFFCQSKSDAETVSYRWLRDGAPIAGATASTYTPGAEDEGTAVQCQVSASDGEGTTLQTSKPQLVAPVEAMSAPRLPRLGNNLAQAMFDAAKVSGTPAVGQTLTCEPGSWSQGPTFSYQWLRNGTPISGATASTYVPTPEDRAGSVQCELTATNATASIAADSPPLVIEPSPPAPSAAPTITGTPAVGQTLTCNPGSWSGGPTFAYQWTRSGANIAGATSSTYTLGAADEGKSIQCRIAVSNADIAVGAAAAPVVIPPPPGTTPPALSTPGTITGTAQVGETLTCGTGTWTGSPTFGYRWMRNGTIIAPPKATPTYTLEAADRGKEIQCQVTGTNAGGGVIAIDAPRYVAPVPPETPPVRAYSVYQVYETSPGGVLRLVSVLPDGSAAIAHTAAGTGQGGEGESKEDSVHNAVSADGSRVFWTADEESEPVGGGAGFGNQPGQLYLRLNATAPQSEISGGQCTEAAQACTIAISETFDTRFISADSQGTKVIYTLGNNNFGRVGEELFEARIEESGGHMVATSHLIADSVKGVMGTSNDASRIYFASTEILGDGGPDSHGATARVGEANLYLYETGAEPTFIGRLSDRDFVAPGLSGGGQPSPIAVKPDLRTSRVSADGLRAVFTSAAPLTGYDNSDVVSGAPDAEVFVYDASANGGEGELVCASCNPSGARPAGRMTAPATGGGSALWAAAQIPVWISHIHPGNALSESGKRVFFNSFAPLVRGDTNGKQDVYQWEAPGEGDCTEAAAAFSEINGGCISLISSGESPEDSRFFDATPSGSDVFFATQSSLLVQDYGLVDVYDARVNGGFPAPVSQPPSCEGEACQGTPSPPNDPTPASATFQGAGNVKESGATKPRCAKGKARKKGRCVKKAKKPAKQRANNNRRNGR
jgi:hypothetical protein